MHMFGPGETIEAIINKLNNHSCSKVEMDGLITEYNKMNEGIVPRQGLLVKIPIKESND